jgi:ABC-type glycerol-3-phosphate transport system permease component
MKKPIIPFRISALRFTRTTLIYLLLILVIIFLLFPIYWIFVTSLKTSAEALAYPPSFWPKSPTLEGYPYVIKSWSYWNSLTNTVVIAGFSALIEVILGGMAAYAFSRANFPGKSILFGFIILSMALPGMVSLGPIFIAYNALHWLDSRAGVIAVFVSGGLPFATLTMYAFINSIPKELDDAAAIDGCGWFETLFRVIMPLATTPSTVTFLLLLISGWNEFLLPFILTVTPQTRVLTVRLQEYPVRQGANIIPYELIAAGGVLVLLPLIPILILAQKRLVEGILAGAFK